ncbi:hypothetical protein LY76DRAFT_419234 [Colletotrichum caudatum]|nr:hypothetical protein LY76DRAFT_419234 [Colletotrichum caudatum]
MLLIGDKVELCSGCRFMHTVSRLLRVVAAGNEALELEYRGKVSGGLPKRLFSDAGGDKQQRCARRETLGNLRCEPAFLAGALDPNGPACQAAARVRRSVLLRTLPVVAGADDGESSNSHDGLVRDLAILVERSLRCRRRVCSIQCQHPARQLVVRGSMADSLRSWSWSLVGRPR